MYVFSFIHMIGRTNPADTNQLRSCDDPPGFADAATTMGMIGWHRNIIPK